MLPTKRKCAYCSTEFVAKNESKKFCTNKCRTAAHREKHLRCGLCGHTETGVGKLKEVEGVKWGADGMEPATVGVCKHCYGPISREYPHGGMPISAYAIMLYNNLNREYSFHRGPEGILDEITSAGDVSPERLKAEIYSAVLEFNAELRRAVYLIHSYRKWKKDANL